MKKLVLSLSVILIILTGFGWTWMKSKYQVAPEMLVSVVEYSSAAYSEDPAAHSVAHNRYQGRSLRLIQKDGPLFDFVLESTNPKVARVAFKNIDLSLFTPRIPEWTRHDEGLKLIALTDREWNRQQVAFQANSPHIEVTGGDGFEKANLFTAELANNCLNAGLWEVLLFTRENGQKTLYYQGWFTFPRGHYAKIFEEINQLPYRKFWHRLEHWVDPTGTVVNLKGLRKIVSPTPATITFRADERVLVSGEQVRKMRTCNAPNVITWADFYDGRKVEFATFRKPGRYDVDKPWRNEYWRIGKFQSGKVSRVAVPGTSNTLHEMELVYRDTRNGAKNRLIIGGLDLNSLPQLETSEYSKGFYMPMGIGVPPFYQAHEDLLKNPPHLSPYYNVLLDHQNRWIDHHKLALDGMAAHRDKRDPNLVHLYLLSYERNTLIGHYTIQMNGALTSALQ